MPVKKSPVKKSPTKKKAHAKDEEAFFKKLSDYLSALKSSIASSLPEVKNPFGGDAKKTKKPVAKKPVPKKAGAAGKPGKPGKSGKK